MMNSKTIELDKMLLKDGSFKDIILKKEQRPFNGVITPSNILDRCKCNNNNNIQNQISFRTILLTTILSNMEIQNPEEHQIGILKISDRLPNIASYHRNKNNFNGHFKKLIFHQNNWGMAWFKFKIHILHIRIKILQITTQIILENKIKTI